MLHDSNKFSRTILLGLTFVLVLAAWACSQNNNSEGYQAKPITAGPDGKAIYKQYCVTCHGANGRMQLNGARDFTESELNLEQRIAVITNGKNMMASYKGLLSAEEIRAVARYTQRLSEGKR